MPSEVPRESWLDRLGLNRPELRAWAMYDWANSAFWTTVIAVVFPYYFARVLAADLPAGQATSYFAWTSALAVAVARPPAVARGHQIGCAVPSEGCGRRGARRNSGLNLVI